MTRRAIYLINGVGPDEAISQGLSEAGCQVYCTQTVSEAIHIIKGAGTAQVKSRLTEAPQLNTPYDLILVAAVKAGAIPLMTLLREQGVELPPTLVFDEEGKDVHTIIRALQLGAREYVLGGDTEMQRRLSARLLAERTGAVISPNEPAAVDSPTAPQPPPTPAQYEWDPIGRVIHISENYLRLSSVEGRIFDALLNNRNRTVPVDELVRNVLIRPNLEVIVGARRLRPHVMRLRRKLERYPALGMRIVNMRGTGYMLI